MTGIDDASYSGLYSLVSDYFGPKARGRVYGLLQISLPLGFQLGLVLASAIGSVWGWRNVFYIAGTAGILVAVVIFFGVKEVPRGKAEPELADLETIGSYRFDFDTMATMTQDLEPTTAASDTLRYAQRPLYYLVLWPTEDTVIGQTYAIQYDMISYAPTNWVYLPMIRR